jgi:hypothetical protein
MAAEAEEAVREAPAEAEGAVGVEVEAVVAVVGEAPAEAEGAVG